MWLLLWLSCFCVALLSGLGVGGGGLLAVVLSLFSDLPPLTVQGINLYFFLFSGSAALLFHLLRRNIPLGITALCTVWGLVGTVAGSAAAHAVGGGLTRKLFGLLLILAGLLTLFRVFGRRSAPTSETAPPPGDKKRP